MNMSSPVTQAAHLSPDFPQTVSSLVRLTVEQYHEMAQAGILEENDQIELLDGLLVRKMTKNRAHSLSTRAVRESLERLVVGQMYVDSQEPITTVESEPEPDAMVVRGRPSDYPDRHPSPPEILLVVEVADSSLAHDRGWKKRIYARAGIRTYWIVNLADRQVEVYTKPTGPTVDPSYGACAVFSAADELPIDLDGQKLGQILVKDLI